MHVNKTWNERGKHCFVNAVLVYVKKKKGKLNVRLTDCVEVTSKIKLNGGMVNTSLYIKNLRNYHI